MDAGILFDPEESPYKTDGGATLTLSGQFQMDDGASEGGKRSSTGCDIDGGGVENTQTSAHVEKIGMATQTYDSLRATLTQSSSHVVSAVSSLRTEISQPLLTIENMFSSLVPTLLPWGQIVISLAPLFTQDSVLLVPSASLSAGFTMLPSSYSPMLSVSPAMSLFCSSSSSNVFHPSSTSRSTSVLGSSSSVRSAPSFIRPSISAPTPSIARPSHQTIIPAVSAKAASFNVHPTSWYMGIVFGTISGVALLVFLIAAILCMWKSARRRRQARDTFVPWAPRPGDEEEGRLTSRSVSSRNAAADLGSFEDSTHFPPWSPGRDRSAREPLWAGATGVNNVTYSLRDHPIPGHGLFSDATPAPTFRPTSASHPTVALRQLPSHLIDEELCARAMQDGSYLAGRPVRLRKSSHSRMQDSAESNPYIDSGDTLRLGSTAPADQQRTKIVQQSMAERLRNLGKQHEEPSWDRLPTPGRDQPREDVEPWASSFKSSLVSAFNAFAAGLTSSGAPTNPRLDDGFTTAPIRRRESIRDNSHKPLTRKGSSDSKDWVLHEKGDGTGTVQFLPTLEKYEGGKMGSKRPGKFEPLLSFGDGESITTYEEKGEHFRRTSTRRSLIPLVVSSTPAKAIIRPESPFKRRESIYSSSFSRNSSVYSTASSLNRGATRRKSGFPRLPRVPSIAKHGLDLEERQREDLDTIVIEPDELCRLSVDSAHPMGRRA